MQKYVQTGKCIWCGRTESEVSFLTEPHVLPRRLGGKEIGFDVCDECNHYFGTAQRGKPAIDVAFKEIFNAFRTFSSNTDEHTHEKFKSIFFDYRHSKHSIRIRPQFNSRAVTEQFKRGLYEVFLQRYHHVTGNGNAPMFDMVRKYARYGIGRPHVFYKFDNILLVTANDEDRILNMSEPMIKDIMESGMYCFWLFGHVFYLEILPLVYNAYGMRYLQRQADHLLINIYGNERIFEFRDVMEIDFCMERFNSHGRRG